MHATRHSSCSRHKLGQSSGNAPELGAAVGVAGEEGGGGHAAGVTWLSGSRFKRAGVA